MKAMTETLSMTITMSTRLLAVTGALALGACAATGLRDQAQSSACRPEAAAALVGQPAPDDETVLNRVNGKTVRRIAPGDATTRDFREDRVTLTVADGKVVAAACG